VDAAVDKLFEGHGFDNFAATVLEAIKAGLRQTFSDAIKDAIKNSVGVIFKGLDMRTPLEKNTDAILTVKTSIDKLREAISGPPATPGILGIGEARSPEEARIPESTTSTENVLEGIADILSGGNQEVVSSIEIMKEVFEATNSKVNQTAQQQKTVTEQAKTEQAQQASNLLQGNNLILQELRLIKTDNITHVAAIQNTINSCCQAIITALSKDSPEEDRFIDQTLQGVISNASDSQTQSVTAQISKSSKDASKSAAENKEVVERQNQIASQGFDILANLGIQQIQAIFLSAAAEQASGLVTGLFSIFGAGQGGVFKDGLTRRQGGGITAGPELALIGEGQRDEAVVPLPNNREIPVDLSGAAGDTIQIEQNFDFRGSDANTVNQLRAESRAIEDRTFNRVFLEINKGGKYAKISGRR
jgi:hypothetical protein